MLHDKERHVESEASDDDDKEIARGYSRDEVFRRSFEPPARKIGGRFPQRLALCSETLWI